MAEFRNLFIGIGILAALCAGYYFYQQNSGFLPGTSRIVQDVPEDRENKITDAKLETTAEKTETTIAIAETTDAKAEDSSKNVRIANWNMQIFGDSKAGNQTLMDFYAVKIANYDIFFVQEIRDSDNSSFSRLCSMLTNYECSISSRAGRSTSKEQYGIIYRKGIALQKIIDYNPDSEDRWERPPLEADFVIGNYTAQVFDIHTKPEATPEEMESLESLVKNEGNVAVMGDMNADGSYYNHTKENDFSGWSWLIKDGEDTSVALSRNAYDRIIVNSNMNNEVVSSGIDSEGITPDKSDHYIIWFEIKPRE